MKKILALLAVMIIATVGIAQNNHTNSTRKTATSTTRNSASTQRNNPYGEVKYHFYGSTSLICGHPLTNIIKELYLTLRNDKLYPYIPATSNSMGRLPFYFKKSDDKGSYYEHNDNGTIRIIFINKNHNFAYYEERLTRNTVNVYYFYSSREQAQLHIKGMKESQVNIHSNSNSSSNNISNSTSSSEKRRGCGSCSVPGGPGRPGNGQCRGCLGSGTKMILGNITVCPNCMTKYETRGNGRCQWCRGTGWKD